MEQGGVNANTTKTGIGIKRITKARRGVSRLPLSYSTLSGNIYDSNWNITSTSNGNVISNYGYDTLNRRNYYSLKNGTGKILQYSYDSTVVTVVYGTTSSVNRIISEILNSDTNNVKTFNFDIKGNLTKINNLKCTLYNNRT